MLTSCISFLLADLFLIMNYRTSLLAYHGSLTSFISMSQFPWVRSSLCLMVGLNFWAHKAENLVSKDQQPHKGITCLGTIAEFPTELLACIFNWKKKKKKKKKKYLKSRQFPFKSSEKDKLPKRLGRQILRERPSQHYFSSLTWPVWKCRVKHKCKHLLTESHQLKIIISQSNQATKPACLQL